MPNVPDVPGVPALSSFLDDTITLLVSDAVSLLVGAQGNTYDVLLDGSSAFDFNSILRVGYDQEYAVADYKVEPGSFVSYDKVQQPAAIRLRCTSLGDPDSFASLVAQIQSAVDSTNLYDIQTPQQLYQNYNPVRWSYEQTATNGVGMLIADIMFLQIRESEAAAFSNTQQPGSAGQAGAGNVQPRDPTAQEQSSLLAPEDGGAPGIM
ncbi:hypothetical protein IC762_17810 [Bradyrhizobium genosp. L]|uniref:phage baseplate protein n=1 Tax=Bradyrhizobium genosp. L TaxID=83637 RepID=UPI0018A2A0CE|nr:hypothetical protein [Bradyrhizobium genosp. L]QPF81679.1 hypothetical protein IC762_17810 [Bradyrhizobium genosp. L]